MEINIRIDAQHHLSLKSCRGLGDEAVEGKHSASRCPGKEFSADIIASVKTWSREIVFVH